MMANDPAGGRQKLVRIGLMTLAGGAAGGLIGFGIGKWLKATGRLEGAAIWPAEDFAALVIAAILVFAGTATWLAASSPARYARMIDRTIEPGETVDPEALWSAATQGLIAILAGGLLAAPAILANTADLADMRGPAAIAILAVLAWQSWLNLRVWRRADELTRAVIAQTGALCFWTMQLALFVWATLAKLTLVPEVSSWALLTVLMGGYLIASFWVSWRRGLVH